MPLQVSHRMRRSLHAGRPPSLTSGATPVPARMSSTSWEACQKKRYGLIVVPKTPTTTAASIAFGVNLGQNVRSATWLHGT